MANTQRIVVGILSCQKNVGKKRAVEATWLRDLKAAGVTAYFLVGRPGCPERIEGDVLFLDCADTYVALCEKVIAFLRYARANLNVDFIFKCDDDTYLDVASWSAVPYADFDYTAGQLLPYHGGYRTWMVSKGLIWKSEYEDFMTMVAEFPCGGEGYFLSRRAIDAILSPVRADWIQRCPPSEDVMVAGLLKLAGIVPHIVRELAGQPGDVLRPWTVVKDAQLATIHPVGPLQMRMIHWRHHAWIDLVYVGAQVVRHIRMWISSLRARRRSNACPAA